MCGWWGWGRWEEPRGRLEGGSEQRPVNAKRLGASEILSWKMLVGNAADRGGEGLLSICTYWLTDPGK